MDWIDLDEDKEQWKALVNKVLYLRLPYNVGTFLNSRTTGGFSRRTQLHAVNYLNNKIVFHEDQIRRLFCWAKWLKRTGK
jgi:hypothetical protein